MRGGRWQVKSILFWIERAVEIENNNFLNYREKCWYRGDYMSQMHLVILVLGREVETWEQGDVVEGLLRSPAFAEGLLQLESKNWVGIWSMSWIL